MSSPQLLFFANAGTKSNDSADDLFSEEASDAKILEDASTPACDIKSCIQIKSAMCHMEEQSPSPNASKSTSDSKPSTESESQVISLEEETGEELDKCIRFWKQALQENLEPIKCALLDREDKKKRGKESKLSKADYEELMELRKTVAEMRANEQNMKGIFKEAVAEVQNRKLHLLKVRAKPKCKVCRIEESEIAPDDACNDQKLDYIKELNTWEPIRKIPPPQLKSHERVDHFGNLEKHVDEMIKKMQSQGDFNSWHKVTTRDTCECNYLPDCICNTYNVVSKESVHMCYPEELPTTKQADEKSSGNIRKEQSEHRRLEKLEVLYNGTETKKSLAESDKHISIASGSSEQQSKLDSTSLFEDQPEDIGSYETESKVIAVVEPEIVEEESDADDEAAKVVENEPEPVKVAEPEIKKERDIVGEEPKVVQTVPEIVDEPVKVDIDEIMSEIDHRVEAPHSGAQIKKVKTKEKVPSVKKPYIQSRETLVERKSLTKNTFIHLEEKCGCGIENCDCSTRFTQIEHPEIDNVPIPEPPQIHTVPLVEATSSFELYSHLRNSASGNITDLRKSIAKSSSYDLLKLCLEGPKEKLDQTKFCQPAVLVTSLAAIERLKEERPNAIENCVGTAGFSLGELTSLIFAGSLGFERGLHLVKVRAEAMQLASEITEGHMATVVYGPDSKLNMACLQAKEWARDRGDEFPECTIANYLFPHCKVVSGSQSAIKFLERNYKEFSLRRVKRLPVSGAFHSKLMEPALEPFRRALRKIDIEDPAISVYSNIDGRRYHNADHVRRMLPKQIVKPVKWEQLLHVVYERGQDDHFPRTFECGPGKSLRTILKQVNMKAWSSSFSIEA